MEFINRHINPPLPTDNTDTRPPTPVPSVSDEKTRSGPFGKVLKVIGAITLISLVIFGIFIFFSVQSYAKYQQESKTYVDSQVPKILKDWNRDALLSQADEQFLSTTSKDTLDKLFLYFSSKLGSFIQYERSTLVNSRSYSGTTGNVFVVVYASDVQFKKGFAQIITTVQNKNGKWSILGFRVNSDAFLNQ